MRVFYPPPTDEPISYPAMVFFSGGGWASSNLKHFEQQARYFATRGIVCFLAEYRARNPDKGGIFDGIVDAKSSIRYVREHAKEFNVDKNKIIAVGASAGGHLAATTAMAKKYEDKNDNLAISPVPNALVLFNPLLDLGPADVRVYGWIGEKYKDISPLHNIKPDTPPTILFYGTEDGGISMELSKYYKAAMNSAGSRCELFIYEGQKHGFFRYSNTEYFKKTLLEADKFLISLGYLKGEPTIMTEK